MPDIGVVTKYQPGGGLGIRFDDGCCAGSEITPYFDSLLVKIIAWGSTFKEAAERADRALDEMEVEGVKTNKEYLRRVLACEDFQKGCCSTNFIEDHFALLTDEK